MGCGSGCEIVGALIVSPGGSSPVYTKPMPRGGEAALVSVSVSEFESAGASLEIDVQTKNSNETSWSGAGTITSITSADVYSVGVSGLKQFVRLSINFGAGASQGDLARLSAINFSWRPF